jgi:DNA-binding response OmpR family regulator
MSRAARIMIVDDEPNIRLMFRTALEAAGHVVSEAPDGEAALAALRSAPADLVLLDLRMPLLDGMATLRRLRDEGSATPVVIVTAHGSVPDAVEAMKLGAVDFLQKPLSPETLRAEVAEVLGRHDDPGPRAASPALGAGGVRYEEVLGRAKRALNCLRPDEAELFLRRAIELDPRSPEAHTLLGVVLTGRGEPHAAEEQFRAALEADPDYKPATHNLHHLKARFGA